MNNQALEQYAALFVQTVGRPVISRLENETAQPIVASLLVVHDGRVEFSARIPEGEARGALATGEVRLKFRERAVGVTFEAQAILRGLAPDTGYSGFLLQGRITGTPEALQSKLGGQTNTYNVWDWRPEFRCASDDVPKS